MLYLGILREDRYSPNRISDDRAIFNAVCKKLKTPEDMLFRMHEDEFAAEGIDDASVFDAVFHSCRSDKALSRLRNIMDGGVPVINNPDAVVNCRRTEEVRLLMGAGLPFVKSAIVDSASFPSDWNVFPCWIKRGDTHALEADDVCYVHSREEADAVMRRISEKGAGSAVIQEHVEGHIVKFYGVGQGRLFRYRFLENVSDGKFGLEAYNKLGCTPLDEETFRSDVMRIASVLGIDIYGGDAIVTPQGKAVIVDFNDWPSFFMCREDAAEAISELVREKCAR